MFLLHILRPAIEHHIVCGVMLAVGTERVGSYPSAMHTMSYLGRFSDSRLISPLANLLPLQKTMAAASCIQKS